MQTPKHVALSRFVSRLQLNTALSPLEQQAIMGLESQVVKLGVGCELVAAGQTMSHCTLVASGNVGRFEETANGSRQITAIYMAGDMCNLESIVASKANASFTSFGACTVLHVAHTNLRDIAVRFPNIGLALWRDTILDASILSKWLVNVGRRDARARTAHIFCELGIRIERAKLGRRESYQLTMTQGQIADAVGITHVHVNRMLQDLKADGLMAWKSQWVMIEDWKRLACLAQFSPTYLHVG